MSDARCPVAQVLVLSAHEGVGGQYSALLLQAFVGHHENSVLQCRAGSKRCFWRSGCGGLRKAQPVEKNQAGNVKLQLHCLELVDVLAF